MPRHFLYPQVLTWFNVLQVSVMDAEDKPDEHTLSMLDWQEDALAIDLKQRYNDPYFPNVPVGELLRM